MRAHKRRHARRLSQHHQERMPRVQPARTVHLPVRATEEAPLAARGGGGDGLPCVQPVSALGVAAPRRWPDAGDMHRHLATWSHQSRQRLGALPFSCR